MDAEIKARLVFDKNATEKEINDIVKELNSQLQATGFKGGKIEFKPSSAFSKMWASGVAAIVGAGTAFAAMVKASPRLDASMKHLTKSVLAIIRPLGDLVSYFIGPIGRIFRVLAINILKLWKTIENFLKKVPGGKAVMGGAGGAITGALAGAAIGAIGGPIGAGAGAIIGGIAGILLNLPWGDILKVVQAGFQVVVDYITHPEKFFEALYNIGKWIVENIPGFITQLYKDMGYATGVILRAIVDGLIGLGKWIWESLVKIWKLELNVLMGIGKWIWNAITGFIKDPLGTLANFGKWIWDTITGILSTAFNALLNIGKWIWDTITGFIDNAVRGFLGLQPKQSGGYIPTTGPYLLHAGETVIPRGATNNYSSSPTININATVRSESDIQKIAKEVHRMVQIDVNRRI